MGPKKIPTLADFRPAAMRLINNGCGSANCHNQARSWVMGRKRYFGYKICYHYTDTASFYIYDASTGAPNRLCQLINKTKLDQIWKDYKDSVKTYYADTINKASFRILKTFTTPWGIASRRGPLWEAMMMSLWIYMFPKISGVILQLYIPAPEECNIIPNQTP